MKKAQLREFCTQYGPIEFFWMDYAVGDGGLSHKDTVAWVKSFQPGCFVGFNPAIRRATCVWARWACRAARDPPAPASTQPT